MTTLYVCIGLVLLTYVAGVTWLLHQFIQAPTYSSDDEWANAEFSEVGRRRSGNA